MSSDSPAEYARPRDDADVLGIKQTSFTWANDADVQTPASTSSGQQSRRFVLNVDGELLFKRGCTNLIIGPTGSGKTSLLMALLGEMHARPAGPESFVSLPRGGGVAYAAQESWVLSDTIRVSPHIGRSSCIPVRSTDPLLEQHPVWRAARRGAICEG